MTAAAAPKDQARDLEADLAICEAATPGPYQMTPCGCGHQACNQFFISVTHSDGRLDPDDAYFIVEAREGWAYAIRRAMEAEDKIDRLRNELNILQQQVHGSEVYVP